MMNVKPMFALFLVLLLGVFAAQVAATGDPPPYHCAADGGLPSQTFSDYTALQEIVEGQSHQDVLDSLQVPANFKVVIKNGLVVALIVDAGEEIDDEMAIAMLARYGHLYNIQRLVVIFVNGKITGQERINQWKTKFGDSLADAPLVPEYVAIDDAAGIIEETKFDVVIQIAPLYDDKSFKEVKTNKYFFAGDFPTPKSAVPSFNLNGSDAVLSHMQKKGILHTISSSLMATMKPSDRTVKILGDEFADAVKFTAFKLGVSRMPPSNAAKKYAEGLVHYEKDKTRGANWFTVKKLFHIITGKNLEDVPDEAIAEHTNVYHLAKEYFREIFGDTYLQDMKYGVKAIKSLALINYALEIIVPGIWQGRDRVIFSTFDDETFGGDITLQQSYNNYKEMLKRLTEAQRMDIYNPAYDLFAVMNVLAGVQTCNDFYEYFQTLDAPALDAPEPMKHD